LCKSHNYCSICRSPFSSHVVRAIPASHIVTMRIGSMLRLLSLSLLTIALPRVRADEPLAYPPPAQVRAAFLKLLDRPKVPAEPKVVSTKSYSPGWVLEQLSIASEKKADAATERVPILILRPEKSAKKLPAVIVLHG